MLFQSRLLGIEPFGLGMLSVNVCLSQLSWALWEQVGLPVTLVLRLAACSAFSASQQFLSSGTKKVVLPWSFGDKNVEMCMRE